MRSPSQPRHELVNVRDVERRTGLPLHEAERASGVQTLVRVNPDGTREQMLRIPVSLLVDCADGAGATDADDAPELLPESA